MAHLNSRLQAFVKLGDFFREYCEYANDPTDKFVKRVTQFTEFDKKIATAGHKNGWFTRINVLFALRHWADLLTEEQLLSWLGQYNLEKANGRTVAIIMAGNVPLVGFHDFLSALITGNKVIVKLSSNDNILLPFIADYLIKVEPGLAEAILFQEERLDNFDMVIATGSDNTARYFNYY
ncbi:MAG: acyl-CoA reductase, partial [Eudoraea sp.]|nr:acyl-CoA reductase [Eudoraea sp.]